MLLSTFDYHNLLSFTSAVSIHILKVCKKSYLFSFCAIIDNNSCFAWTTIFLFFSNFLLLPLFVFNILALRLLIIHTSVKDDKLLVNFSLIKHSESHFALLKASYVYSLQSSCCMMDNLNNWLRWLKVGKKSNKCVWSHFILFVSFCPWPSTGYLLSWSSTRGQGNKTGTLLCHSS